MLNSPTMYNYLSSFLGIVVCTGGHLCGLSMFSLCCCGFLPQSKDMQLSLKISWWLEIAHRCKCVCDWLFVSIYRSCDWWPVQGVPRLYVGIGSSQCVHPALYIWKNKKVSEYFCLVRSQSCSQEFAQCYASGPWTGGNHLWEKLSLVKWFV